MRTLRVAIAATALLAFTASAAEAAPRATVTLKTVVVGKPNNPGAGIVPFTDAIYQTCASAPQGDPACQMVGGVDHTYDIGQIEVTVAQWIKFLNTVDPHGLNRHNLFRRVETGTAWPKYGQINFARRAKTGRHYTLAYPQWADKPYGFADFPRAARFINSLYNGRIVKKVAGHDGAFPTVTYKVTLSALTERGMYDLARNKRTGATRAAKRGFVVPSQDEWIKAAYYDPSGGGTYSYWKYPTNAGVFGDGTATAPASTTLDAGNGNVTNSSTQPVATYHASGVAAPTWCPSQVSATDCDTVNPFHMDQTNYQKAFQGSVGTVGQAKTVSPWGTLDQGGNAVEWTDTITPPPTGQSKHRVWRRLHGGVPNAPAYQLWLSAIGPQPESNRFFTLTYPWLGFRIGVIGDPEPSR